MHVPGIVLICSELATGIPPIFLTSSQVRFQLPPNPTLNLMVREELMDLIQVKEVRVAYIIEFSYMKAKRSAKFLKKLVINVMYLFLRKNCRGPSVALNIFHISLIEVSMMCCI